MPQIFISHTADDAALVEALVELLKHALSPAPTIRATCVPEGALKPNRAISTELKAELRSADVFIGVMTDASVRSPWVLTEVGARWSGERAMYLVHSPNVNTSDLGPHSERSLVCADSKPAVLDLLDQVGRDLGTVAVSPQNFLRHLEEFVKRASVDRIAITEPAEGAVVDQTVLVAGTVGDPGRTRRVVVAVHPLHDGGYYVQGRVDLQQAGTWRVLARVGRPGLNLFDGMQPFDTKLPFQILAVGIPDDPAEALYDDRKLLEWPRGRWRSSIVTVRRR